MILARPPVSTMHQPLPSVAERAQLRAAQRDAVIEQIARYNSTAVLCCGVPFGHTRPQWIVPHGGTIIMDGISRTITADYN